MLRTLGRKKNYYYLLASHISPYVVLSRNLYTFMMSHRGGFCVQIQGTRGEFSELL